MFEFPDFSRLIFIHSQYLKMVWWAVTAIFILYLVYSLKIWGLHKRFGGYEHTKSLAKKIKTGIDGPIRLAVKTVLVTFSALLIGLTILGPKIKESHSENEYKPAQVVIAMDISVSMLAEDIKPSRLLAAKSTINNVLERLKNEGSKDRVGLIKFTDIAIPAVIIPTKDYNLIEDELRLTTAGYLKLFETHGTNIWDAVTQGLEMFDYTKDEEKILIIPSDGEQVAESDYIDKTRQEAINKRFENQRTRAIKIFVVGIGRSNEPPALIPKEKDENGNVVEFYAQTTGPDRGKLITTRPDLSYLEETANLIDGKLLHSEDFEELNKNVDEILNQREIIGVNQNSQLKDVSPWFIGAALILLFFVPIMRLG